MNLAIETVVCMVASAAVGFFVGVRVRSWREPRQSEIVRTLPRCPWCDKVLDDHGDEWRCDNCPELTRLAGKLADYSQVTHRQLLPRADHLAKFKRGVRL